MPKKFFFILFILLIFSANLFALPQYWSAYMQSGISTAGGNNKYANINLGGAIERKSSDYELSFSGSTIYGNQTIKSIDYSTGVPNAIQTKYKTVQEHNLRASYDHKPDEKLSWFGFISANYNRTQLIDLKMNYMLGAKYTFFKEKTETVENNLSVSFGAMYETIRYLDTPDLLMQNNWYDLVTYQPIKPANRNRLYGTMRPKYVKRNEYFTFKHITYFMFGKDFKADSTNTLSTPLSKTTFLNLDFNYKYTNKPIFCIDNPLSYLEKSDWTLTVSLMKSF
ncbi:DUF481 domain-containing protein [Candidatus Dependentiae bacterium]|nr:DUF481 domain-containing protein [Candidatus Dependentiae bacterium]